MVGDGRVPMHALGDVIIVTVTERRIGDLRVSWVWTDVIPPQHPHTGRTASECGFVGPPAHRARGAEYIANPGKPISRGHRPGCAQRAVTTGQLVGVIDYCASDRCEPRSDAAALIAKES